MTMAAPKRVVTLSPHLTEWMYSLDAEDTLVGVSAYSDFPPEAASLPVIADYNGANLASIMALKPDLILAWQGGNKPQDTADPRQNRGFLLSSLAVLRSAATFCVRILRRRRMLS